MEIKQLLTKAIIEATQKAMAAGSLKEGSLPDIVLTVPPQKEFGDFATNFAMQAAKTLHAAPRQIAQAIKENLSSP